MKSMKVYRGSIGIAGLDDLVKRKMSYWDPNSALSGL
jgi:hypothetical protein